MSALLLIQINLFQSLKKWLGVLEDHPLVSRGAEILDAHGKDGAAFDVRKTFPFQHSSKGIFVEKSYSTLSSLHLTGLAPSGW